MSARELRALPKAHLHLHLEAAIRPATLAELTERHGLEWVVPPFTDFSIFSTTYRTLLAVLSVPENLARLIDETVADGAADGAVYLELSVVPNFYAGVFGTAREALRFHLEAARAAALRHGVEVGLAIGIDRTLPIEQAMDDARLAAEFAGEGVVALGLANDERGFPVADFAPAFRIAADAGLLVTPHAGELCGPAEVRAAVEVCEADRVLHGVRAVEDPDVVALLVERGIALDVCPTSNVLLGVAASLAEHPLPALLAAGVRCSINADDPILFGPGLLDEYETSRSGLGLSDEQLAACALTSIETSGASDRVKQRGAAGVAAWLAA